MSMTMEKLPSSNSCFGLRLERNIKEYPSMEGYVILVTSPL